MIFRTTINGRVIEVESVEALKALLDAFPEGTASRPASNGTRPARLSDSARGLIMQLEGVLMMVAQAGENGVPVSEIASYAKMDNARGLGIFANVISRYVPGARLQDVVEKSRGPDGVKRWFQKPGLLELKEKLRRAGR